MPDHAHFLFEGLDDRSHFTSCITVARQRSARTFRKEFRERLWQDGYFDRVLRDLVETGNAIRYIADNPVRAGLCARSEDYAYCWLERDLT